MLLPFLKPSFCLFTIKQATRAASALLHSAAAAGVITAFEHRAPGPSDTSLASTSPKSPPAPSPLQPLREANGLAQHHDAITGTAKLPVLYDYLSQLSDASNAASEDLARNLKVMTRAPDAEKIAASQLSPFTGWVDLPYADAGSDSAVLRPVIVYNSLLQQRNVLVVIRTTSPTSQPLSSSSSSPSPPTGSFTDALGDPISCEAIPCSATPACPSSDGFLLHAQIDVPALGFTTVFVNGSGNCDILQPQNASWIECDLPAPACISAFVSSHSRSRRYLSTSTLVVAINQVGGDNGTHVLHSIQRPSGDSVLPSMSLKSLTSNGDGA
jgi:hypothetical protein